MNRGEDPAPSGNGGGIGEQEGEGLDKRGKLQLRTHVRTVVLPHVNEWKRVPKVVAERGGK